MFAASAAGGKTSRSLALPNARAALAYVREAAQAAGICPPEKGTELEDGALSRLHCQVGA